MGMIENADSIRAKVQAQVPEPVLATGTVQPAGTWGAAGLMSLTPAGGCSASGPRTRTPARSAPGAPCSRPTARPCWR
jgi:hypothetical protein